MSDLAALKKQRSTNKGKLTNIIKFVKEANIDTPLEQLHVRLTRVEQLMREFTELESSIFKIDSKEQSDEVYEENYYNAIAGLNTIIREKNLHIGNTVLDTSANTSQLCARSEVKLPKINIPYFSGDYSEWQSFFDLYTTTIHESPSLNAVQKFQYLKGLLRGEAAILLRHITVTENNYISALNKLKERYDRKKHIINTFIRNFIEQPSVNHPNVGQLKRIMDTSDEVIRGLKALGEFAESRDPWIIYILLSKLDDKSKVLWAEMSADIDNPAFPDFLKFLARRIDTLESLSMPLKRTSTRSIVKGHLATNEPEIQEAQINTIQPKPPCAFCQNNNHSIFQCSAFQALDSNDRREFAKKNNRCYNCLSNKHAIFKCPSRRRCQRCGSKHNTLLHPNNSSDRNHNPSKESSSSETTTCHSQNLAVCSILPTAIVKVLNYAGNLTPCRALLDSGSQTSFITESCVQRLRIKRRNARISVSGLGQLNLPITRGSASLIIKADDYPQLKVEALILPQITSQLPQQNLEVNKTDAWNGIRLADPHFQKTGNIDILIGADHFFNILQDGQIRSTLQTPILQNTIFGWIVSGQINNSTAGQSMSMHAATRPSEELIDIDKSLSRFWELDSVNEPKTILSVEEVFCENHFHSNLKRNLNGRFVVRLPFIKSPSNLG